MDKVTSVINELNNRNFIESLIRKRRFQSDKQTIYGDLCDWMRDYHNDLSLYESQIVIESVIGHYVVKHIWDFNNFFG